MFPLLEAKFLITYSSLPFILILPEGFWAHAWLSSSGEDCRDTWAASGSRPGAYVSLKFHPLSSVQPTSTEYGHVLPALSPKSVSAPTTEQPEGCSSLAPTGPPTSPIISLLGEGDVRRGCLPASGRAFASELRPLEG